MPNSKTIVIGGSVIGLCTAWRLLERGIETTVLDAAPEGGDNGARENAGMIVPSHFIPLAAPGMIAKGLRWLLDPESPFAIRIRPDPSLARWGWLFHRHSTPRHVENAAALLRDLHLESRQMFCDLAASGENFGLTQRGLIMLCKTQQGLDDEAAIAERARQLGLRAELLDAPALAKLDPSITMNVLGGVHFADDCHLDPSRLLDSLRARITRLGGHIRYQSKVESITRHPNGSLHEVHGRDFTESADHFVIAAGMPSTDLLKQLGIRLPMQPGKGYSLTLPQPPQLPQTCSILTEAKIAVTPVGSALRFAGTMEIGNRDHHPNPARLRGIVRSAHDYFPEIKPELFDSVQPWIGHRPVTPDGLPYLGRASRVPNLVIATGHAMMGLSLGPVTGEAVADLITNHQPPRQLSALDPQRFGIAKE